MAQQAPPLPNIRALFSRPALLDIKILLFMLPDVEAPPFWPANIEALFSQLPDIKVRSLKQHNVRTCLSSTLKYSSSLSLIIFTSSLSYIYYKYICGMLVLKTPNLPLFLPYSRLKYVLSDEPWPCFSTSPADLFC